MQSRGGFTPRARGAAARGGAQKYKEQLFNEQPKTTRIVLLLVYGCMIFSGRDYLAPPGDSSLDPPLIATAVHIPIDIVNQAIHNYACMSRQKYNIILCHGLMINILSLYAMD